MFKYAASTYNFGRAGGLTTIYGGKTAKSHQKCSLTSRFLRFKKKA